MACPAASLGAQPGRKSRRRVRIKQIGHYRLENRLLGKGNFARVELATHTVLGLKVAVKVIDKTKIVEDYVRRNLWREARILAKLRHPNVATLYEAIESGNLVCLVMELAGGGDLCSYVKAQQGGKLGEPTSRHFLRQIVSALSHMHNRGIVHRDLKMENVILDASQTQVKIVDFGLSNFFDSGNSLKTHCGSPEYAAPELFVPGKTYGPEVDIWSLGVIMYGALTGSLPFLSPRNETTSHQERRHNLYKKIHQGLSSEHWRILSGMTSECRSLLFSLLTPNPQQRIQLPAVRGHSWLTVNGCCPLLEAEEPSIHDCHGKLIIRDLSERLLVPASVLVTEIERDDHCAVAAMFYLLLASEQFRTLRSNIMKGVHTMNRVTLRNASPNSSLTSISRKKGDLISGEERKDRKASLLSDSQSSSEEDKVHITMNSRWSPASTALKQPSLGQAEATSTAQLKSVSSSIDGAKVIEPLQHGKELTEYPELGRLDLNHRCCLVENSSPSTTSDESSVIKEDILQNEPNYTSTISSDKDIQVLHSNEGSPTTNIWCCGIRLCETKKKKSGCGQSEGDQLLKNNVNKKSISEEELLKELVELDVTSEKTDRQQQQQQQQQQEPNYLKKLGNSCLCMLNYANSFHQQQSISLQNTGDKCYLHNNFLHSRMTRLFPYLLPKLRQKKKFPRDFVSSCLDICDRNQEMGTVSQVMQEIFQKLTKNKSAFSWYKNSSLLSVSKNAHKDESGDRIGSERTTKEQEETKELYIGTPRFVALSFAHSEEHQKPQPTPKGNGFVVAYTNPLVRHLDSSLEKSPLKLKKRRNSYPVVITKMKAVRDKSKSLQDDDWSLSVRAICSYNELQHFQTNSIKNRK